MENPESEISFIDLYNLCAITEVHKKLAKLDE